MKKLMFLVGAIGLVFNLSAQKIFTKKGIVKFTASSSAEPIAGKTNTASSVIDKTSGNIEFAILVKSIKFDKALMEEHFNENYMESNKFPKATFKGKIANLADINWSKDGKYTAKITGDLTLHGVTKQISTSADLVVKNGKVDANAKFNIEVEDYKIEIPSLVKDKIAKTAKIEVIASYENLK